ncbi:MAG: terminase family protein [Hyphomicrobiales bacterium]
MSDLLESFSSADLAALLFDWPIWAREDQLPPLGDRLVWLIMGGRGAGKTRAGAEWVRGMALGKPPFCGRSVGRIALIGETLGDVRDVMIEGESGILRIHPKSERPEWKKTKGQLEWKNGAIAQIFSAEDPDSLRGPQFDVAWSDELCKWRHAEATWDMLQFGLRLGERPRQIVTTTPRPIPLLKRLLADERTRLSKATTMANATNLAPDFIDTVRARYGGTRLGRQELDGELIEDREDALWQRDQIEKLKIAIAPPLARVVVAIDPPATSHAKSDACGLIVAGVDEQGIGYVLADGSKRSVTPTEWASRAVELYHRYQADLVLAEVNQGGEMVNTILAQVDKTVPVKAVRASRGKYSRAEPVSYLYERGLVRHMGSLSKREDEMCDFGLEGLSSGRSPDRLDALVWALHELMLKPEADPKIRRM